MATPGEDPKRLDSSSSTLKGSRTPGGGPPRRLIVKNLSELVIVVNGELTATSYAKLSAFTDNIILRENKGLDAWSYKTALESYGWDRLVGIRRSSIQRHHHGTGVPPSRRCSPRWPAGTSTGHHLVP